MNYFLLVTDNSGRSARYDLLDGKRILVSPGDQVHVIDENDAAVDVTIVPSGEDLHLVLETGDTVVLDHFLEDRDGTDSYNLRINHETIEASDFDLFPGAVPGATTLEDFSLMRFSRTEYNENSDEMGEDQGSDLFQNGAAGKDQSEEIAAVLAEAGSGEDERSAAASAGNQTLSNHSQNGDGGGENGGGGNGGGGNPNTPDPENAPPIAVDDALIMVDEDQSLTSISVLGNDTDPDGDPLTVVAANAPNGSVAVNSDGTLDYIPDPNFHGSDTITYTISDGNGGTDIATVQIVVEAVNDPPVAVDDVVAAQEDTPITLTNIDIVDTNDSDVDGDALTITGVQSATNGTVSLVGGDVVFTPNANYNGPASFEYIIEDGMGGSDIATVSLNVGAVNDPPDAQDDTASSVEDTPITLTNADLVDTNDTDLDGDNLTIIGVSSPMNGSAIVVGGDVIFTPDPDHTGFASFDYTISDGNGGTDTASVTVSISAVNDPPGANDDTASGDEDTPVTLTHADIVGSNDTDVDGDPLTILSVSNPSNGTVTIVSGNVVFTPTSDYSGPASFDYTITDGAGGTDTATVSLTINPVNDVPVAVNDSLGATEDQPITLTNADLVDTNDSDADNDALTIIGVSNASNGTVSLVGGDVVFTPDPNYSGPASFDYTISDGNLGTNTATVSLTISPDNDPPDAVDDTAAGLEDTPVTLTYADLVTANDTDVEGDTLTILNVSNPLNGTVSLVGSDVVFTPDAGYTGPAHFDYTISDGNGGMDTATVTVNVAGVNDPPVAVDDSGSTDEDTPLTLSVLSDDTDPEGDTLSILSTTSLGLGSVSDDGTDITFDPGSDFEHLDSGDTATVSFTYTISDGNGGMDTANVNITVVGVDDPTITNEDFGSTDETTQTSVSVLNNDSDVDDALTLTGVTQPSKGSVNIVGSDITFDPGTDFLSLASGATEIVTFSYTVTTDDGDSVSEMVTITVTGVDTPTTGSPIVVAVEEDTTTVASGSVVLTDPDGNDATVVAGNQVGTYGTFAIDAAGNYSYTLNNGTDGDQAIPVQVLSEGQTAVESFSYSLSNGATQTVTVTVTGDNDEPVFTFTDPDWMDAANWMSTGRATLDLTTSPAEAGVRGDDVVYLDLDESQMIDGGTYEFCVDIGNVTGSQPAIKIFEDGVEITEQLLSDNTEACISFVYDAGKTYDLAFGVSSGVAGVGNARVEFFAVTQSPAIVLDASNPFDSSAFFEDIDLADTLSYSATLGDGSTPISAIGLSIDSTTGEITGSPTNTTASDGTQIILTADDGIASASSPPLNISGITPPIVIDLDGDGAEFRSVENGIQFDVDDDGQVEQTAWAAEDDAVLVFDGNHNNLIDDRGEFAFADYSQDANATDLEGLREGFDSNDDGVLDSNDKEFDQFKLWQDRDGDGQVDAGEMMTLGEAGIESIELTSDGNQELAADGDVIVHGTAKVHYEDGSVGEAADAGFAYEELDFDSVNLLPAATADLLDEKPELASEQSSAGDIGGSPSDPMDQFMDINPDANL